MIQRSRLLLLISMFLFFLTWQPGPAEALDPRFELDTEILRKNLPAEPPAPRAAGVGVTSAATSPATGRVYMVKRGDTLMRILIGEFGLSRERAVKLLPAVVERNRLQSASRIATGEKLFIPLGAEAANGVLRSGKVGVRGGKKVAARGTVAHRLSLFKSSPGRYREMVADARRIWKTILPSQPLSDSPFSIRGGSYSLDLDPDRFPRFPAADGGEIVVEAGGRLSPLVRSLINQHDPDVRFVTLEPEDSRGFFSGLLSAAGFYSVEEGFSVSFGADPRLTVNSDFKVESDPDAPLNREIFIINGPTRAGFPGILSDYMAGQGFRVVDLSHGRGSASGIVGTISVMSGKGDLKVTDAILAALAIPVDRGREIDIFSMGDSGVMLRVWADRYFTRGGERFVISRFRGDPEDYTLLRLLQSTGYRVVVIDPQEDDGEGEAEKVLSMLGLPGEYAMHDILASPDLPYSIEMSGIMVESGAGGGRLFLTGKRPDPLLRGLLELNGFRIIEEREGMGGS